MFSTCSGMAPVTWWSELSDMLYSVSLCTDGANGGTYEILLGPQTDSLAELELKHTILIFTQQFAQNAQNLNSLRFPKSHKIYFVTEGFMGEVKTLLLSCFSGLLWSFFPSHLKFRRLSAMSEIYFSKQLFAVTGEKSNQENQTS